MKKIIAVLLIGLLAAQPAAADREKLPGDAMEQTIVRLLYDAVFDAIEAYYGEPRQYWRDELLGVRQAQNGGYEVVLRVETFCGPHNPPYGLETMTFHIDYGEAELVKYEHEDEET